MTRRKSLLAVPAAAAASSSMAHAQASGKSPVIIELRTFHLRNSPDMQGARTNDFLSKTYLPALGRAGGKVHGVFSSFIAPGGPFVMVVSSFASLGAMDSALEKLNADKAYQKQLEALDAKGGLSFTRMETQLLRAFGSMPEVENPPVEAGKPGRLFELRTYESSSPLTLKRKIGMFESGGEIDIFRRVGITPVFFGETIAGTNMPNLTYLVVYDSLAGRDKAWSAFLADPAWLKLRGTPGLSDAEIVSNISNVLLRPAPYSPLK